LVSGIQEAFFEMFPHQNSVHSGIPPIIGIFEDNSASTGSTSMFHDAVTEFENFYEEYSFTSGVHYQTTDLPATGYINIRNDIKVLATANYYIIILLILYTILLFLNIYNHIYITYRCCI